MKGIKAILSKSIYGSSWQLEQLIGGTLHYDHFDTRDEAVRYAKANGYTIMYR